MKQKKDITIAGAGPAGMAAGIVLAKAGYKVSIFEQHSGVGKRFNDDFQGLENWSYTEDVMTEISSAGVEPTWWFKPVSTGTVYDPHLRSVSILSKEPFFYLVRRGADHPKSLDLALEKQARELGVKFFFNKRSGKQEANILATGPRGIPKAIAAGITFKIDRDDLTVAILSDDLAPAGYVYFLIADRQATLATVLFDDFKNVHHCLERTIDTIRSLYDIDDYKNANHWGGYGSFTIPQSSEENDTLIVGEAAGFQDYLFGFGIRNALVSGILAAQSIIENQSYDALWRERLLPHLQASAVNRAVYGRFTSAKNWFWHAVGKNSRPENFMHWLYNFSPIHKTIYPFITMKQ